MIQKLCKFIEKENLFASGDSLVLSVSGGKDSMVMISLILGLGNPIAVAHVNHMLRTGESDRDERFVRECCKQLKVPCYTQKIPTGKLQKRSGENLQLIARELRYEYLEKIRKQLGFQRILTAHHLDDHLETFFLNLTRGAGLAGLSGIPVKNGLVVRPMMAFFRREIDDYAKEHKIKYREDSSNSDEKYTRNKIRHRVIPALLSLRKGVDKTLLTSMENLRQSHAFQEYWLDYIAARIAYKDGLKLRIDKHKLEPFPSPLTVLYHLCAPYNFNRFQVENLIENLENIGIEFHSVDHKLINDRQYIYIEPKVVDGPEQTLIVRAPGYYPLDDHHAIKIEPAAHFTPESSPDIEYLDGDLLVFPLAIRSWQPGDWFKPVGMQGKSKKLQDFFTDQKIPKHLKKNIYIMESAEAIAWVIGFRLDDRFKLTEGSKKILRMEFVRLP